MTAVLWALLAACVWGIVPILEKLGLGGVPSAYVGLFYRCLGVLLGLLVLGLFIIKPSQLRNIEPKTVFLLILSGFLASFVAQIFFYHGLRAGEASRIVPIVGSYPMITFILAVLLLGEGLSVSKIIGVILISGGIWLLR
ncbi:MAG: EamA family transporter [Candidatus Omnitrophica bacterium]|nr:EamA family transporter [Candidatus Omnitrophota bacterium]